MKVFEKFKQFKQFSMLKVFNKNLGSSQRYTGFTLAEVLITLGIIGVVAVLTIPTLMAKFEKQQYVTQLKETYSLLSQALNQVKVDEGVSNITDTDLITVREGEDGSDANVTLRLKTFMNKYFKIIKDCGRQSPNLCFPQEIKNIAGYTLNSGIPQNWYCALIANGSTVCINPAYNQTGYNVPGMFTVDINGLKKPNTDGRDIFTFDFYYDGSIDDVNPECRKGQSDHCRGMGDSVSARNDRFEAYCLDNGGANAYGVGCFGKILNDNWKMDY